MINYNRSAFGLNLLFRIHGSAIYRAFVPGFFAAAIFMFLQLYFDEDHPYRAEPKADHPYAIGVVITGTTFLIVFRNSQGYSRYWEASGAAYSMMSKWMDSAIHTACYHLQCDHYDHIKPPSYYDYPELNRQYLTRDRERVRDLQESFCSSERMKSGRGTNSRKVTAADKIVSDQRAVVRSINMVEDGGGASNSGGNRSPPRVVNSLKNRLPRRMSAGASRDQGTGPKRVVTAMSTRDLEDDDHMPRPLLGRGRLDGNWGALFDDEKSTYYSRMSPMEAFTDRKGFASTCGGRTAPLFLQELAHLTSLLNAVALSTLRNDVDGAESPLDLYEPGTPWPSVDPSTDPDGWGSENYSSQLWRNLLFFLGFGRTAEERTRYNASRPLPVLGGVSDNEIRFLQMARGPYAKTQLCWAWLSEFITREHLAGSLGKVGPPIISRVIQFLGDGMTQYNQARKIMFIPFPFVHAQLSAAFVLLMIPTIPFLMDQYTHSILLGSALSFFTTLCLSGIHEVARELENPFRNVPNELPVVTLQAEFNESLLTMYAGYHPDFYWDPHKLNNFHTKNNVLATDFPTPPPFSQIPRQESFLPPTPKRTRSRDVNELAPLVEIDDIPREEEWKASQFGYLEHDNTVAVTSELGGEPYRPVSPVAKTNPIDGEEQQLESHPPDGQVAEVDRLKSLVESQAQMMERMMEEQDRLNKLVATLMTGDRDPESSQN